MYFLLIVIIAILFSGLLFLNIYFRVKVFKAYKTLVQNRVDFNASHIFNKEKMENEIIRKHPEFRTELENFVKNMRFSINMATVLIVLITIFGAVLMWYR
jgi:hypothetical protein